MLEGTGQPSRDCKAEALPQPHGGLVGADDEVELHGAIAAPARLFERVQAERTRDAVAACFDRGDVAAVGDVRAAARLVGTHEIAAEHAAVAFGDERLAL